MGLKAAGKQATSRGQAFWPRYRASYLVAMYCRTNNLPAQVNVPKAGAYNRIYKNNYSMISSEWPGPYAGPFSKGPLTWNEEISISCTSILGMAMPSLQNK